MMEHQRAAAETIRASFEGCAVARKRIEAAGPRGVVLRSGVQCVVLSVVEHELETPIGRQGHGLSGCEVGEVRCSVPVPHMLDVPSRLSCVVETVPLMRLRKVETEGVLG